MKRFHLTLAKCVTVRCIALLLFAACASHPPPLPANAGKMGNVQLPGVSSIPGTFKFIGQPIYGSCRRILSIDGGGIKGVIPAMILEAIEKDTGRPISALFDVVVGTSTGAILALGLARPDDGDAQKPAFRAADLVALYRKDGSTIFPSSPFTFRGLKRLFRPKYGSQGIDRVLERIFADVNMQEALTHVIVPAYELEERRHIWFNSWANNAPYYLMKDIVRGSTAAPTYLPPVRIAAPTTDSRKGYYVLIDGGVFANNPALTAMAQGVELGEHSDAFFLLSLGTGINDDQSPAYSYQKLWSAGVVQWIGPLLDIGLSDPSIDDEVRRFAAKDGNTYIRLQVHLSGRDVALDDASAVGPLTRATNEYLATNHDKIEQIAHALLLPRPPRCKMLPGPDIEPRLGPRKRPSPIPPR
jgi:predicted acylesterase/phospholipase RssA